MIDRLRQHPGEAPVVFDEATGRFVSYGELRQEIDHAEKLFSMLPRPALAIQLSANGLGALTGYLACLAAGIPLMLADPESPARESLIDSYRPTVLLVQTGSPARAGFRRVGSIGGGSLEVWARETAYHVALHPELALLLPTSGSTGNPKVVRLSRRNLEANARSIAQYLELGPAEVAIQSLPMHYSYGLSIVNSHVLAGGALVPTQHSFLTKEFWGVFDQAGCTSFAGVPYIYETLHRLRINPGDRRTLRTMTQAGGHLRPEIASGFHQRAQPKGQRFFVMYGQTEATARISYVPPARLAEKLGSIGIAIPSGQLSLEPVPETDRQQLVYRGPNVMLGYAANSADLALGDTQGGVLATGDLAEIDGDGFFRITGRLARFAKLFGRRVQLADVEAHVEQRLHRSAAVVEGANSLEVYVEAATEADLADARASLCTLLTVPPAAIRMHSIAALPKTSSGKKDYRSLAA